MANNKPTKQDKPQQLTATQDAWNALFALVNKASQSGLNSTAVAAIKTQSQVVDDLINP